MKAWVFYHRKCTDGAAAAYAAWKKFGAEARYMPIAFNQSVVATFTVDLLGQPPMEIYFLDVTPNPGDIALLTDAGHTVTVVDHHETYYDFIEAVDMGAAKSMMTRHSTEVSGSRLAWDLFHGTPIYPDIVLHTNDYDMYTFRFGDRTRQYQAAFELVDLDNINAIVEFAEQLTIKIVTSGAHVLVAKNAYAEHIAANAFQTTFEGIPTTAVFCPRDLRNDVADRLLATVGSEGIVIAIDHQGLNEAGEHQWGISLRVLKSSGFNVAELAAVYGGGGHAQAAGMVVNTLTMFGIGEEPKKGLWQRTKALVKR